MMAAELLLDTKDMLATAYAGQFLLLPVFPTKTFTNSSTNSHAASVEANASVASPLLAVESTGLPLIKSCNAWVPSGFL